jgi:integrase
MQVISLQFHPAKKRRQKQDMLQNGIKTGGSMFWRKESPVFRDAAREWWALHKEGRVLKAGEMWTRVERDALPYIGDMRLSKIDAPVVLDVLKRVQARGAIDAAYKLKSTISQIYRYGIARGYASVNPARDIGYALQPRPSRPLAALIDPARVGQLMRDIEVYPTTATKCALRMMALTFVRTGELRRAEWTEIDIAGAEWRIPAKRMKMRRPHIVPLAGQTIDTLFVMRELTGEGRYVFPHMWNREKAMCPKRINAALRRLGYTSAEMCGHGFRAMAASLLSEREWSVEVIERQLAHVELSRIRAVYHRSEYLETRRRMMQAWADYLDELRGCRV